jgi:hypothetical protein
MAKPDETPSENGKSPDQDMASADVANGERPEQPESSEHAAYERERTDEHPVGDERASRHREEESPS